MLGNRKKYIVNGNSGIKAQVRLSSYLTRLAAAIAIIVIGQLLFPSAAFIPASGIR